jgi:hypothetical protein
MSAAAELVWALTCLIGVLLGMVSVLVHIARRDMEAIARRSRPVQASPEPVQMWVDKPREQVRCGVCNGVCTRSSNGWQWEPPLCATPRRPAIGVVPPSAVTSYIRSEVVRDTGGTR